MPMYIVGRIKVHGQCPLLLASSVFETRFLTYQLVRLAGKPVPWTFLCLSVSTGGTGECQHAWLFTQVQCVQAWVLSFIQHII